MDAKYYWTEGDIRFFKAPIRLKGDTLEYHEVSAGTMGTRAIIGFYVGCEEPSVPHVFYYGLYTVCMSMK